MQLILVLLQTLTFRKIWALISSQISFINARLFGVNIKSTYPPYVTIEPTNRCNLNCPECVTGSQQLQRSVGDLSLKDFKKIVDEIYRYTLVLNLYMQGEPYLNKELSQMIAYAKSKNLFVSLSTNAQRLPELKERYLPHHLVVSVDGATQKSYAAYRVGGKLSKVQDFVKAISDFKQDTNCHTPYVEIQFLVNKHNEGEQNAVKVLFKGQYNRFVTKTMQIINEENKAEFTPQMTCCNRYVNDKAVQPGCYKMLSTSVFTQNVDLALCCMDKNAEFVRGNLLEENYKALLNNDKAHTFRKMLIDKKSKISICNNCPFG